MNIIAKEILEENNWKIFPHIFESESIIYYAASPGWAQWATIKGTCWSSADMRYLNNAIFIADYITRNSVIIIKALPQTGLFPYNTITIKTVFDLYPVANFWKVTNNKWLRNETNS